MISTLLNDWNCICLNIPRAVPGVLSNLILSVHSAGWWRSLHPKIHRGDHSGNLHSQIPWQIRWHRDCSGRPEHLARLGQLCVSYGNAFWSYVCLKSQLPTWNEKYIWGTAEDSLLFFNNLILFVYFCSTYIKMSCTLKRNAWIWLLMILKLKTKMSRYAFDNLILFTFSSTPVWQCICLNVCFVAVTVWMVITVHLFHDMFDCALSFTWSDE